MIVTNQLFLQKEGVNRIELGIKGDPTGLKNAKEGVNTMGSSLPLSSMGVASQTVSQECLLFNQMFGHVIL